MHTHIRRNNLFWKIMVFLNWTMCAFHLKGLKMSSVQTENFQSITLLSKIFLLYTKVEIPCFYTPRWRRDWQLCGFVGVYVCVGSVCVRERVLTGKHSSIHTEGTIVGSVLKHNNLCSRQPMSFNNTFPCFLPIKAKNFKLRTK